MSSNSGQRFLNLASTVAKSVRSNIDSWSNNFTGLGIFGKDKRTGALVKKVKFAEKQLEDIYDGDDIGAKVVDMIPEEGTRDWIIIKVGNDEKTEKAIVDDQDRLLVKQKVRKAWKWKRLYGGAGIYISVDDGLDPAEPINKNRLVKINSLTVLHRYELQAQEVNRDIDDPNFGLPEFYTISPRSGESSPRIHHSRIVRMSGDNISESTFIENNYWGESVLTRLYNVLRNFNLAHDSAASIVQDFNVGILKLRDLADLIGADKDDQVKARLQLMNLSKSVLNTILLDADEESFENQGVSLTNLDKTLDKINERLVAATNMPHTKILGNGPKSTLSGGGDSEEKDWLAQVGNLQVDNIEEPINQIMELQLLAKQGPTNGKVPENWEWEFTPLWQPTEKEIAEVRKIVAETDKIYWETGVLSPKNIAEQRFGDEYSMETKINPNDIKENEESGKIPPEDAKKIIEGDKK